MSATPKIEHLVAQDATIEKLLNCKLLTESELTALVAKARVLPAEPPQ